MKDDEVTRDTSRGEYESVTVDSAIQPFDSQATGRAKKRARERKRAVVEVEDNDSSGGRHTHAVAQSVGGCTDEGKGEEAERRANW